MVSLADVSLLNWYPLDTFNRLFRRKRAIKALFVGESGRFETRILMPKRDQAKGESITYRGGTYSFDKDASLFDSATFLPFCMYQVGNPVPLPVTAEAKEAWIEELSALGVKTATQYDKAFRAKIVEDLLYAANTEVHKRIDHIFYLGIASLVVIAVATWMILNRIDALQDFLLNLRLSPGGSFP